MPRTRPLAVLALCVVPAALAEPAFDVTLNQAQSSVTATLTVQGQSSTDSSPVIGSMRIRLDSVGVPTSIELHDFIFSATQPLDFNIIFRVFGIPVGSIVVNASNISVQYASPGVVEGPVPISATNFSFTDVPSNSSGTASYNATGTVCTLLQAQTPPQPCSGMFDLAEAGTQNASALPGSVVLNGRTATVSGTISISGPLDPANPSLGSLAISGVFVGTGQVPYCPGDFNQSGSVGVPDIFAFLSAWFAGLPSADLDGAPGIGVSDIFAFLGLWFAPCA